MEYKDWNVLGSRGERICGTSHAQEGELKGVVLLGHGFKGYKEYGMLPWLAQQFAKRGYCAHRFNFSHSGMLEGDGPFVRPDLFKKQTWNTQVEDVAILCDAFSENGLPLYILGHSRGGVACLLAAGRGTVSVDGVLSLSAPSTCNPLTKESQQVLLAKGSLESPSSRTDQLLEIGACFVQEQLDDPTSHALLELAGNIESPVLIVHGEEDSTVPVDAAIALTKAVKNPTLVRISGGDHVMNTSNPFEVDARPSPQLQGAWDAIEDWL